MNARTQRAVRQSVALPEDDWQPHDWDVFWSAHAVLAEELDRADGTRKRAKAARSRSAKRTADAIPDTSRAEVYNRSRGNCEAGAPVCHGIALHIHHKAGRTGPDAHSPEGLLHVCRECHEYIHAHPAESRERGWMESRLGVVR